MQIGDTVIIAGTNDVGIKEGTAGRLVGYSGETGYPLVDIPGRGRTALLPKDIAMYDHGTALAVMDKPNGHQRAEAPTPSSLRPSHVTSDPIRVSVPTRQPEPKALPAETWPKREMYLNAIDAATELGITVSVMHQIATAIGLRDVRHEVRGFHYTLPNLLRLREVVTAMREIDCSAAVAVRALAWRQKHAE